MNKNRAPIKTSGRKKRSKRKKILRNVLIGILLVIVAVSAFFFLTPKGKELRITAAEIILSSQHRELAVFTFLDKETLDAILYNIQHPEYKNTYSKDGKNDGSVTLVNEKDRKNVNFLKEPLVMELTHIKKKFSESSYYEGVVLEVSNPSNVQLYPSSQKNHGQQIFEIAKNNDALAAINASGFVDPNGRGNGGTGTGVIIIDGESVNGTISDDKKAFVAALTDNYKLFTGLYSANELLDLDVQHAAGFKPQLIADGEKMVEGDGGWGIGPRTAIGQKKDGTIVMVVIDGRQTHSIGASLKEVQDIMYDLGVVEAMAMDGGSSSSMYLNGDNITTPSSRNNIPRYLPNIWGVVPHKGQNVKLYIDGEKVDIER